MQPGSFPALVKLYAHPSIDRDAWGAAENARSTSAAENTPRRYAATSPARAREAAKPT
jgi:hypothetical protein